MARTVYPEPAVFTHRTWLPIAFATVVTLSINVAVLVATTQSVSAVAPVPIHTEAARIGAVAAPATRYRVDARLELDTISRAALSARQRLDAAAESSAHAQTHRAANQAAANQAAAEQAAAELRAVSHTTDAAPPPKEAPAENYRARAEHAADAVPFDWRARGITFEVGCHPEQSRCSWGVFDHRVDEVWLSSAAFASDARLRYVVAHELAHAWQWSTDLDDRKADLTDFGVSTSDGIEYGADCLAEAWGHTVAIHWDCPSGAVAHMRSVFAATT